MKWSSERGGTAAEAARSWAGARGAHSWGPGDGLVRRIEGPERGLRTGWLEEGLAGGSGGRLTSEWSGWYLGGVVGGNFTESDLMTLSPLPHHTNCQISNTAQRLNTIFVLRSTCIVSCLQEMWRARARDARSRFYSWTSGQVGGKIAVAVDLCCAALHTLSDLFHPSSPHFCVVAPSG
jgi:hypothetical protein